MSPDATLTDALRQRVQTSLDRQGMMQALGVKLLTVAPEGMEVTTVEYKGDADQVPRGALIPLSGGLLRCKASPGRPARLRFAPCIPSRQRVIASTGTCSASPKINFLAAFQGGELQATGRVVRGGKRIIVTAAEVVHVAPDGQRSDCAVMQQTLVPVPKTY